MDKVSVIMPVYNAEKYIEKAIQSVVSQSYSHWELLIVDDCSTDYSVSIIEKYVAVDSRIRLLKNLKSSGLPGAPRNKGVQEATGRFIAFLDSDDLWLPNKLTDQISLFNNPSTAIVYSNYEKITEEGVRSGRLVIGPQYTTYKKMLKGNVIGNLTGMYDTKKVGKVFFLNIHHEDYVLWLSILKQNYRACNTNSIVALYRIRKHSVSSRKLIIIPWQWYIYVNIECIGYLKAIFYYSCYAYHAFRKSLI